MLHITWNELHVNVKVHIASGHWKLQITTYQETNVCVLKVWFMVVCTIISPATIKLGIFCGKCFELWKHADQTMKPREH